MLTLLIFSFISGLVTILSPCIWPVLPIIFSFSLSHPGKSRPLGITLGIVVSFTILTLTLSLLVRSLGINPNLFRILAVLVITFFGLTLISPSIGNKVEVFFSRILSFTARFQPQNNPTFFSGFLAGLSLGALWTPCAGPILATVITLAATGHLTFNTILVTLSYVIGVGVPLFIFSLVGQHLFSRLHFLSSFTPKIQKIFGVIMITTAVLIFFNFDTKIQSIVLNHFPSLNNPFLNPENNPTIRQQLNSLKGSPPLLNLSAQAPEFASGNNWLNSAPLTIASLKGKVVLIDFWTYTCINCIRTLPHLTSWYEKYKDKGFVIIGVHTPEFEFEKETNNVARAIDSFQIKYPVVQDNNYVIWNSYQNQYWPAEYLIDATGRIRRTHFGEGEYDQTEAAIQSLLTEAGYQANMPLDQKPDLTPAVPISPESYLGSLRAQYYYPDSNLTVGTHNFILDEKNPVNSFSLGGSWNIASENAIVGEKAVLNYHFFASKVFLVLRPAVNAKSLVNVYLDGKFSSQITIDSDRLYTLIDLNGPPQDHTLKLEFLTPGTQLFAFTFG